MCPRQQLRTATLVPANGLSVQFRRSRAWQSGSRLAFRVAFDGSVGIIPMPRTGRQVLPLSQAQAVAGGTPAADLAHRFRRIRYAETLQARCADGKPMPSGRTLTLAPLSTGLPADNLIRPHSGGSASSCPNVSASPFGTAECLLNIYRRSNSCDFHWPAELGAQGSA